MSQTRRLNHTALTERALFTTEKEIDNVSFEASLKFFLLCRLEDSDPSTYVKVPLLIALIVRAYYLILSRSDETSEEGGH